MNRDDGKIARLPVEGVPTGDASAPVPDGKLEVIITYLEMLRRPPARASAHRAEQVAVMRARRPTASFYRYLYETVGAPWLWYERRRLDDEALAAIVQDPAIDVEVLYVDGVPAGYFELDCHDPAQVELSYFGLVPEFIGRGLGSWFLAHAVDHAWAREPRRVWVHTCTLDHPAALGVYQRAGFEPYRREREVIDDPRRVGLMP